jgi:NADH dehydrogenase
MLKMNIVKQKVLILGGGFGGVKAALELAEHDHFTITLISDQTDFRYYPKLYHTATGGDPMAASIPLTEIFAGKKVNLIHDTAIKLDRKQKKVICHSKKSFSYDILIIALGVITNYFGIKGLKEYSYSIKTQQDAQRLHNHLHQLIVEKKQPDLNYVIIGGGATGVELAGALPSYLRRIMSKHNLPSMPVRIDLVEAESRLMPRMPRSYSYAIQKRLRKLGVKIYLNQRVEAETATQLMVSGQPIKSQTVIWTAGVTNHPFFSANKFNLSEHGRVQVNEMLQAEEDIYVIGDNADTLYSGMAQTALYDAIFVTNNLKRLAQGERPNPYKPRRPIYITPVGLRWAAVEWNGLHIYGWLGWILRELADLFAYHDLQPWWPAYRRWMAANSTFETCPLCAS